jgi:endonuclease/exonuclease/phosphatase family metal-dependent hydrolase
MLRITTWNVLHRIHAVNWEEPAIAAHPDEDARVAAIAARVATLAGVVCLQEVSGDLRVALAGNRIEMRYPRVPRYFRAHERSAIPRDPGEYLVTIAPEGARALHAEAFASDRGKGFQVIEIGDLVVVNTHVSYGDKHAEQCARIVEMVAAYPRVVIVGDFNADRATCVADLRGAFDGPIPAGDLPTRPRTQPGTKSERIDHVLARGCSITEAHVASGEGLSDHNPVIATVG